MSASRVEINFRRLLQRCELMVADNRHTDWRLEKYVDSLQEKLRELEKLPSKPAPETLNEYIGKVKFLKGLIEAEKLPTASQKSLATERLAPIISRGSDKMKAKELHLKVKARHEGEMRQELLGENGMSNELRKRLKPDVNDETGDIDTVLQHHHQIQERLAEEMVLLARNLKRNATDSGSIVKDDTKKISDSSRVADTNLTKLKVEGDRLEGFTKDYNCWMWMMLILVAATFVWMILFMKMFRKKIIIEIHPPSATNVEAG